MVRRPMIAIVGSTGTGKSQLAVSLARQFGGEIINGDALQMYEGLPVTTNKISEDQKHGIPHHLLGCIPVQDRPWTVRQFRAEAAQIVSQIRGRDKIPILAGGTHYYTQALLLPGLTVDERLSEMEPDGTAKNMEILEGSTSAILSELRRVDPEMAARWHPDERRKIRRSLEIYLQTGRPASQIYKEQAEKMHINPSNISNGLSRSTNDVFDELLIFWCYTEKAELNDRLAQRVDTMLQQGLLEEVQDMQRLASECHEKGIQIEMGTGIWIAIGYKELLPYMTCSDGSHSLLNDGIDRVKISTRQYARRQVKWLRHKLLPSLHAAGLGKSIFLLDVTESDSGQGKAESVAAKIMQDFLAGKSLPEPVSLSDNACQMLSIEGKADRKARHCEACERTMMNGTEWLRHLKSRAHKKTTKVRSTEKASPDGVNQNLND